MANAARPIVIYGTAGFAREVHQLIADLAETATPFCCEGFLVDRDYRKSDSVHGLPVLGDAGWLAGRPSVETVIAIGATEPRRRIAERIAAESSTRFATLMHPRAWVGNWVSVGAGSIICAGAVATTDIQLGRHVQLHVNATIGHDTTIADYVTIAPGANVSGRVQIGEGAFIGAGAIVLPDITIGREVTVGAGAVVTEDVPDRVVVAGAPARIMARR
jgi:sugar O-acyltransferase (sialic acid O-acetyltransferase NeuD family)